MNIPLCRYDETSFLLYKQTFQVCQRCHSFQAIPTYSILPYAMTVK